MIKVKQYRHIATSATVRIINSGKIILTEAPTEVDVIFQRLILRTMLSLFYVPIKFTTCKTCMLKLNFEEHFIIHRLFSKQHHINGRYQSLFLARFQ